MPRFASRGLLWVPVNGSGEIRALYDRYRRSVYARAYSLLRDDEAAKDAMQEVFLRVIRGDRRVLREPSPMAWLYRVTTNLCLNRIRDEKRRRELMATQPVNDVQGAAAEVQAMVRSILGLVPPDLQEIAVYHHVDEMTYEEIASLVGLSRRTIGNRLLALQKAIEDVTARDRAS